MLHDHLGLTPCILRALAEREEQLLTVNSLQDELERKRASVVALEAEAGQVLGGGTKGRKLQQLQNDVAALEAALVAAEAEYDKVKERNKEVLCDGRVCGGSIWDDQHFFITSFTGATAVAGPAGT